PTPLPTPAPTPTPVPAPTPAAVALKAAPKGSIEAIIRQAAAVWHVNGDWMVKIARCESGLNPRAYNPRGPYVGLFQFLPSTFRRNGGTDIMDPADQSHIAAKMLAHGQAHQWSCA
ncbi:MAG TPA: transglycosylase SLT domain-containing protein, partial [Candidatus Sulfotelmatobacter sp.]|nr:transglycosylase SLT domain-containing protein [Candidatus Sulfotelmatobacter sp.]